MFDYLLVEISIVGKLHYYAGLEGNYHRFLP